ncbi:hypothetical protein [Agrilutibacter solisilvae]|uniref:hypothetical protein n=1 Tax=Agrilutibacter solisilvae TaxID=2763317 RepID=UPI0031BA2A69
MSRSLSLSTASLRTQATFLAATADGLAVEAGAVVGHFQHDFRPFAADGDADGAFFGLAGLLALFRRFQAVRDGVAEHVLQRRGHALQHVAVQFALGIAQLELDLLAQLARCLAHDAAQARQQRIEGHHARAHEAFL